MKTNTATAGRVPHVVKEFTVLGISANADSFGHKSVICLSEDGEGFEGLVQAYGTDKVPVRGDVVRKDDPRWHCPPHGGGTPRSSQAVFRKHRRAAAPNTLTPNPIHPMNKPAHTQPREFSIMNTRRHSTAKRAALLLLVLLASLAFWSALIVAALK